MNDTLYAIHTLVTASFLTLATLGAWSLVWREARSKHKSQHKNRRQP